MPLQFQLGLALQIVSNMITIVWTTVNKPIEQPKKDGVAC